MYRFCLALRKYRVVIEEVGPAATGHVCKIPLIFN